MPFHPVVGFLKNRQVFFLILLVGVEHSFWCNILATIRL